MTNATNTNAPATLAARAAALLTRATAYGVAEKAMQQALDARRVYPALAADFGQQLGVDLPLKTRDFVRVVGGLLASSEKPIKGVVSKRKREIIGILAELIGILTDTTPIALPEWAKPKERAAKKAETVSADGALERANGAAAASEAAEAAEAMAAAAAAEAKTDNTLAKAVAVVVANVAMLTEAQKEALMLALASVEESAA